MKYDTSILDKKSSACINRLQAKCYSTLFSALTNVASAY